MPFNFNSHYKLEGQHSLLSASSPAWLNYSDEKFLEVARNKMAAAEGTRLHVFAAMAIDLRQKQPATKKTLPMYVNDAIGFGMETEKILYYSPIAFCTTDAIKFSRQRNGRWMLRIHDLKNGINEASFTQLIVYAAYFCLEYGRKPGEIDIELRIYQNDNVKTYVPELTEVANAMAQVVNLSNLYLALEEEAGV